MTDKPFECVTGGDLLKYSERPQALRAFLEDYPTRLGEGPPRLHKSIIVLGSAKDGSVQVRSALHAVRHDAELPMIRRTGKYPPSMLVAPLARYGELTVDPDEQRIGCDYISADQALEHFAGLLGQVLAAADLLANDHAFKLQKAEFKTEVLEYAQEQFKTLREKEKAAFATTIMELFLSIAAPEHIADHGVVDRVLDANRLESRAFMKAAHDHFMGFEGIGGAGPYDFLAPKRAAIRNAFERYRSSHRPDLENAKRKILTLFASLVSSVHVRAHAEKIAKLSGSEAKHIVIQGAGDISMNSWNVAAIRQSEDSLRLVHVQREDLESRQYSCLLAVKPEDLKGNSDKSWKAAWNNDTDAVAGCLAIGRVRINPYMGMDGQVSLVTDKKPVPIGKHLDYALYGQCLARNWKPIEPHIVAHEFSDVRHILRTPSLNPSWDFDRTHREIEECRRLAERHPKLPPHLFTENLVQAFLSKPRYLFGVPAEQDVWLGEHAFLINPLLLRAACDHAVEIALADLGAPLDWITVCMRAAGGTWKESRDAVLKEGDFFWDLLDPTDPKLVWFPEKSPYPGTMVGIGSLKDGPGSDVPAVFLLAWGHGFGEDQGYSIFKCAKLLCDLGAKSVLLIDEGRDVFQYYFPTLQDLGCTHGRQPVPPSREQIRGTLSFWIQTAPTASGG